MNLWYLSTRYKHSQNHLAGMALTFAALDAWGIVTSHDTVLEFEGLPRGRCQTIRLGTCEPHVVRMCTTSGAITGTFTVGCRGAYRMSALSAKARPSTRWYTHPSCPSSFLLDAPSLSPPLRPPVSPPAFRFADFSFIPSLLVPFSVPSPALSTGSPLSQRARFTRHN